MTIGAAGDLKAFDRLRELRKEVAEGVQVAIELSNDSEIGAGRRPTTEHGHVQRLPRGARDRVCKLNGIAHLMSQRGS